MGLQYLCIAVVSLCMVMASASTDPSSGCTRECNGKSVSYPFGLSGDPAECYKDWSFELTCNHSFSPPELLYGNIPVLNISLQEGTIVLEIEIVEYRFDQGIRLGTNSSFRFSSTGNKFIVIGCDTIGTISDWGLDQFGTGCLALCTEEIDIRDPINLPPEVASCSGIGCCQTLIPNDLTTLVISLSRFTNRSGLLDSNPAGFGYVSGSNLSLIQKNQSDGVHYFSQVVVDWAIGGMTCEQQGELICGPNTDCINSADGGGYRCSCKQGFQLGNPYNRTGCKDIDECLPENRIAYPCQGRCKNTPGSYTCQCSFGYGGDGKVGCRLKIITKVIFGAILALLTACGMAFLIAKLVRRLQSLSQRRIQVKELSNRKDTLLKYLSVKIFNESELEKATNNFEARALLGEGGNGWVYRGSLPGMVDIAVKKSKTLYQNKIQEFINEVEIVSKINHKNVVKLLGVCLDTQVPMLVYEYITNGTLFHHLHGKSPTILYSWPVCLRIAAETASALDYMHSLAHPPIIHRDIKSANILLDAKYTAKVADFGASKLIQLDGAIQSTQGEGTMGYLDPEYVQTGELTTMSDVYGFGVVLMELLSKQKPLSRGASGETISLVMVFTSAVEENQLDQVLKYRNLDANDIEQAHIVARLAARCVAMPSKDRPTMKEVAYVLDGLGKEHESLKTDGTWDELVSLLDEEQFVTSRVTFELEYHTTAVTS